MNGMRPATQFLMGCLLLAGSVASAQVPIVDLQTRPGWYVIDGAVAGGHAGAWLHMGDLTGDFFNKELIVGLPDSDGSKGAVRIFFGRGNALADMTTANADAVFTGAAPGDRFGAAVDAGYVMSPEIQLNNGTPVGPTYPRDLIVGAPGAFGGRGAVYIFTGAVARNSVRSTAQAAFTIRGALPGDQLGAVIDSMDFNGDGYREVILAVPARGIVYVLEVRNAGGTTADLSVAIPGGYLTGLGSSISIAGGDVNGDGALDLVVGDPTRDGGRGGVYFFASRPRVLSGALPMPAAADAVLAGIDPEDQFGASLWVADIDDDGDPAGEVVIGAPGADAPGNGRPDAGEVHIVWGGADPAAAFRSGLVLYGAAAGHRLGARVTAGHVTRKSPWDIVMLAPGANGGAGELYAYYGRHSYDFPSAAADMATSASRRIISDESVGPIQTVRVWEATGEGAEEIVVGVPAAAASAGADAGRVYIAVSPRLNLSTGAVTLRAVRCVPGVAEFEITNPSAVPVPWRLYDPPSWVEIQPATGTTSVLAPSRVKLVTRTSSLAPGNYSQRVEILSNGPHLGHSAAIQISLTVDAPSPRAASAHVDFTGDGCGDVATFRATNGRWRVTGGSEIVLGQVGDIPVPGDYNGDWIADAVVYRPSDSTWRFANGDIVSWGQTGDIPVPGDYDGDGRMEIAVYQPATSTWHGQTFGRIVWGQIGDIPVPGDYDGDGRADLAVYQRGTATWKIRSVGEFQYGQAADLPVPADFDGDGRTDIAVYRRSTNTWLVRDQFEQVWGSSGDLPVAIDVDRDGKAELGLFRRATQTWLSYDPDTGVTTTEPSTPGELPAVLGAAVRFARSPMDLNADGQTDITVWRPSNGVWFIKTSSSGFGRYFSVQWGAGSLADVPVGADYDGDGFTDIAVWRPGPGVWYVRTSTTQFAQQLVVQWGSGALGDRPVPADFDGDGRDDIAVWRPDSGTWFIRTSSTGFVDTRAVQWGSGALRDVPVPADFDGDGRADIVVWRPDSGMWYVKTSSTNYGTFFTAQWGAPNDVPLATDFDGDGKADIAVWRPGNGYWYIRTSSTGFNNTVIQQWGSGSLGDVPIVGDFDADGRTDITVWRPGSGVWYVRTSATGFRSFFTAQWGEGALRDVPIGGSR